MTTITRTKGITQAKRYHDICAGHRVHGQGGKCENLHGHNYRVHFTVQGALDSVGRVLDFSVIKEKLCMWLEEEWDHKMLMWRQDPKAAYVKEVDPTMIYTDFNPTAENMCEYLVEVIGPQQLEGTGCELVEVTIEETAKCFATYTKGTVVHETA